MKPHLYLHRYQNLYPNRYLYLYRYQALTEKPHAERGVGRHLIQKRSDFSAAAPSAKGAQHHGMRGSAGSGGARFGPPPRRSPSRFEGRLIKPSSILDQRFQRGASRSHRFAASDLRLAPPFTPQRYRAVPHLHRAKQDPATPRARASLETTGGYAWRS
jgi:hypothetical protein